ncbi:MAG: isopentenyl-diphosphate Delta-isomerase [Planctomycetota bacterium]
MTSLAVLAGVGTVIALIALWMTGRNLGKYRAPPLRSDKGFAGSLVSVCIPARNEEANIEACVRAALASDTNTEVLVYNDESTDRTGSILEKLSAEDPRVRIVPTRTMPEGWSGKQHACDRMGRTAHGEWLLFTDADVRLEPTAVRRAVAFALDSEAELVSTFPRQICGTLGELLQVPMMFFLLFSYLPFGRMRRTLDPSASAGCGQFLLTRRISYLRAGGHAAFSGSMHDGVRMPRAFRKLGLRTDLFDGTDLVSVRMYRGFAESWRGFAKNAYEGLGSVFLLLFITAMHALGHIAPWVLIPVGLIMGEPLVFVLACTAVAVSIAQRVLLSARFGHPVWLAVLHPITVLLMTAVQWRSLVLHLNRARSWRGRALVRVDGERVVLVDEQDMERSTEEKIAAHENGGSLHRAFSVFVFDDSGRTMLQRRASTKYHFGGLWTNTACGHPRPGETPAEGGRRRLAEEMGLDTSLVAAGTFIYKASDPVSGLTEHELDHVLVAETSDEPVLNPDEAEAWRWVSLDDLEDELLRFPESFTPWFPLAWKRARPLIESSLARSASGAS